jgi:hypothetical protein
VTKLKTRGAFLLDVVLDGSFRTEGVDAAVDIPLNFSACSASRRAGDLVNSFPNAAAPFSLHALFHRTRPISIARRCRSGDDALSELTAKAGGSST